MYSNQAHRKNSTITTQVMCAIIFSLFSFVWLFWNQADLLAVEQHVFSKGQTHYNQTIGALLITGILMAVQQVVLRFVKLHNRSHALTYLPSMLLLALLGDFSVDENSSYQYGTWFWFIPIVLLVWGIMVWIARQTLPFDSDKEQTWPFSRRVWMNMLIMTGMMIGVAGLSNTNAVFHFRTHAEAAIMNENYEEALRTGWRSHETDESLTMLRAYALSKKGQLAEHLFEYPLVGRGKDLLPLWDSRSKALLMPVDSFYTYFGARPIGISSMIHYFELLKKDSLAKAPVADYHLCALLMDKKLDEFARYLPHYYSVEENLPKHYREAATLYTHLRSKPLFVYKNPVMEEDWHNFQELTRRYPDKMERKVMVADRYSTSYWYYYFYEM